MSSEKLVALKSLAVEVLKYWEPRRVVYNLMLLWVTIRDFRDDGALALLTEPRMLLILAGCAVAANVVYCAAHAVDFTMQLTRLKGVWLKVRWVLFLAGCWLASVLTYQYTGWLTDGERMI